MDKVLVLGKPGVGKTTYISNLYGVYNEPHVIDRNPKQMDAFTVFFNERDAASLKGNYKMLKRGKEVPSTVALQEFECELRSGRDAISNFILCDNRGGITRQLDWGTHLQWIAKLTELISHDTNGTGNYDFDAVIFLYDCTEFYDDGDIEVNEKELSAQLKTLSDVATKEKRPVYLVFTKRDKLKEEDLRQLDEILTAAQGDNGYLNKIFLQLNDTSPRNRGKIALPLLYVLRKLYMEKSDSDAQVSENLRKYCMHIGNL